MKTPKTIVFANNIFYALFGHVYIAEIVSWKTVFIYNIRVP